MKTLLFFFGALAALTAVKTDSQEVASEMEVDAGSEVLIPCNLKGPKVTWFWIPHYPICAGLKDKKKDIYSEISSGIEVKCERFQNRLTVENSSILILRLLYMNDSGVFYCSVGQATSPQISVTVKPGYQNGIAHVQYTRETGKRNRIIAMTCEVCRNMNHSSIDGDSAIITWTLNGKSVPKHLIIFTLRNVIKIKRLPRQYFGLWKCIRPSCPMQFDGYCLENGSETSKNYDDTETTTTESPADEGKKHADAFVIGGSIAGLFVLLLLCIIIFIICQRRRLHNVSPSERTRVSETQESKKPAGSEASPKRRDEEEPRTEDRESTEGAGDGIQYSALEFKETGQHQIKIDNEASSVIYAQMPTSC